MLISRTSAEGTVVNRNEDAGVVVIESDIGRDGKAVAGSKRAKVVAAINKLDLTPAEKLLLICSQGYTIKDGDIPGVSAARAKQLLLRYILSLKISKEKRARLAELCGFTVQNGKIMLSK